MQDLEWSDVMCKSSTAISPVTSFISVLEVALEPFVALVAFSIQLSPPPLLLPFSPLFLLLFPSLPSFSFPLSSLLPSCSSYASDSRPLPATATSTTTQRTLPVNLSISLYISVNLKYIQYILLWSTVCVWTLWINYTVITDVQST